MSLMKAFYEILYRRFRAPWDIGPRKDLVALIEEGRTHPAALSTWAAARRATSSFWRSNGFDVTGADYAVSVIELGRARAQAAGVRATFIVDDLTNLQHVGGLFDFLVDYGTLDDLVPMRARMPVR